MSLTLEQQDALSRVRFIGNLVVLRKNDKNDSEEKELTRQLLEERLAAARRLGCAEQDILRALPMSMTCT